MLLSIAELIPQCIQLHVQVTIGSLGCHKLGECANACARRPVCFCNETDGDASVLNSIMPGEQHK
jgi:hypothetical protein